MLFLSGVNMKKWFIFLFLGVSPFFPILGEEYTDYSKEPLSFEETHEGNPPPNFWNLEVYWDWISKAKFTTPEDKGDTISYSEGQVELAYAWFLNPCDGLALGLGYNRSYMNWTHNPFFREKIFSKFLVDFQAFTRRFQNWEWRLGFKAAFDTHHFDLYDYTIYDALVWGRYGWQSDWFGREIGLHIGFIGRAGIDKNWIIPIFGFDFEQECVWKVRLVYPVDMKISYYLTDQWSISLAGKIWNTRYRLGKNEPLSQGIFEYRNSGIEVGINYEYDPMLLANLHVGSTLGSGDVKISKEKGEAISVCI